MKRPGKKILIAAVIAALFSFFACYTTSKVSNRNMVDLYNNQHALHPEFALLYVNDSVSQLYFKINESELLYERRTLSDSFSASVRIFCRVTLNYESPVIIDSNSAQLNFRSSTNTRNEFAVGSIPLRLTRGAKYLITVTTDDLQSRRNDITYIEANKMDFLGKQNFLVRNPSNGHVIFATWFDTATALSIQSPHPFSKLYVRFYRNKFPVAAPPFAADEGISPRLSADSSFSIPLHNGVFYLNLKLHGLYHIMADSTDIEGMTLFRFDHSFPYITEAYQMVLPLRYISSNDEFDKLINSKNPKHEVDNFWLTAANGSQDRARELIRAYYNRVEDANNYFTSYQEGWKTDRGMIYIIFGPPSTIYRTSVDETWTYGEERNYMALTFTFLKMENPFSDNDYALQRSEAFRNVWYNAVDLWRNGRVY